VKKTWYRVVLDVAYEGNIMDRAGEPVTDPDKAKEILVRVVGHDLSVALRGAPCGPVDWDLVTLHGIDADRRSSQSARTAGLERVDARPARGHLGKAPKVLYVVVSDRGNPHVDGEVVFYRRKRDAQRACKWSDQKLVVYVPLEVARCCSRVRSAC